MNTVLIVTNFFPFQKGGAELQAYYIATILSERYSVHFIHFSENVRTITKKQIDQFTIWILPKKSFFRRVSSKLNFQYFFLIKSIFRIVKPEICYQRGRNSVTTICSILSKKSSCKFIWQAASDSDLTYFSKKNLYKELFKILEFKIGKIGILRANSIILQSQSQLETFRSLFPNKIASELPNLHPLPIKSTEKSSRLKVLWIANLKPLKQPDIFLHIADELRNEEIDFIMIGAATKEEYISIANFKKNHPNFNYLGELPNETVNEKLNESHLLVNTSIFEGFSNVFIQAWLNKVLVLSLNSNPGNILADDHLGRYFNGDINMLINHIKYFNGEREILSRMGEMAFIKSKEKFSLEENKTKYLEIFEKCIT